MTKYEIQTVEENQTSGKFILLLSTVNSESHWETHCVGSCCRQYLEARCSPSESTEYTMSLPESKE